MRYILYILILLALQASGQNFYNNKLTVKDDGCLKYQCGCGNVFSQKVIAIGDWDMNNEDTVHVKHGLTFADIVTPLSGCIVNDAGTLKYMAMGYDGATTDWQINEITTTHVILKRAVAGFFKSTDFDSTSYNRGYIVLLYKY